MTEAVFPVATDLRLAHRLELLALAWVLLRLQVELGRRVERLRERCGQRAFLARVWGLLLLMDWHLRFVEFELT